MKVYNKIFSKNHLDYCEFIKKETNKRFGLNPINNINLILHKIESNYDKIKGDYVECGTFKGNTLIPVAIFCENKKFNEMKLIGIDSFSGFPSNLTNEKDQAKYFINLFQDGLISEDHFEKAKKRTNNFNDINHLNNEYFCDVKNIFDNCRNFENVILKQGTFQEVTPKIDSLISVLHLDGDLYESYLICLNNLYNKVSSGGSIIFDEYYSHKYPGARVAVNEFFLDKKGYFEKYTTEEGHERWCFVKE